MCVQNNFFTFNGKLYKVKDGVGTGVKYAPPYACLGVGKFEELAFNSSQDFVDLILLWKRFIDDVFMLFKGSHDECHELVTWLNSLMPGIVKFTYEYSKSKINFLDLEIFIEDGKLKSNLFIKPTNLQLYLDYMSNHPKHCKDSIAYGQALRVIERCSRPTDVQIHLSNLKIKLLQRNYPASIVDSQFEKAQQMDRGQILSQKRGRRRHNGKKVRFIFKQE